MESFGDVTIANYIELMKSYVNGRVSAPAYCRAFFNLANKRVSLPEDADRITQQAYGDADDYEPDAALRQTNPEWIGESELAERVAKSLQDLETVRNRGRDRTVS